MIDGVPHSHEFFNIVFFAVLLSTLLQGSTFEPLAQRLGRRRPPSRRCRGRWPRPGRSARSAPRSSRSRSRASDAIVGLLRARPRPAARRAPERDRARRGGNPAARIDADRGRRPAPLLIRQEVAESVIDLTERWRAGPIGARAAAAGARSARTAPCLTVRPSAEDDGDPARPERDRRRRGRPAPAHPARRPGALVLLADGRYAVTGPLVAVGPPRQLQRHIRRELHGAETDTERAWWQEVAGALTSSSLSDFPVDGGVSPRSAPRRMLGDGAAGGFAEPSRWPRRSRAARSPARARSRRPAGTSSIPPPAARCPPRRCRPRRSPGARRHRLHVGDAERVVDARHHVHVSARHRFRASSCGIDAEEGDPVADSQRAGKGLERRAVGALADQLVAQRGVRSWRARRARGSPRPGSCAARGARP